jgi:outer membrane protein
MKRIFLTAIILIAFTAFTNAQKYAYVDTDYILSNIPEYTDAQAQLDDLSTEWQKEIEEKFAEVDKLYKAYQSEAVLLPEEMKKQRENEIIEKEKEAKDLQKQRFGPDGDLHKKRLELIQPIQEKVYNAIESIANTRNFAFIFDRSAGSVLLFVQSKFDLSDDVLDEIGTVMQTVKRENRVKSPYQGGKEGTEKETQKPNTQKNQQKLQQPNNQQLNPPVPPPGQHKK